MERRNLPERAHCEGGALVDVSTLGIDELIHSDNPQLARALSKILGSVSEDGILSAFQSAV